jgi:hypothetical protein
MNHRLSSLLVAVPIFMFGAAASAEPPAPHNNHSEPPAVDPKAPSEPKAEAPPSTSRWQMSFYGFVEFDGMWDSTQSFSDSPGNTPILRSDGSRPAYLPVGTDELKGVMYGATHGRMQATARNTRFGFKLTPPEIAGIKTTGVLEVDLFGNQPSAPPSTTEGSFFTSPTLRLRHAYVKLESDVVDVLFGQYYNLFGWQPNFFPATWSFLGTPNMIFGRTPQVRLSKAIHGPVGFEVAAALTRPPQRDSGFPGVEAGIRLDINGLKGAHGRGSGQPTIDSLSIGASVVYRKFRVIAWGNNRLDITQATDVAEAAGAGYSIDGFIPVIPVHDLESKGVALSLTGSYVKGQGTADLYTGGLTGGMQFPLPAGPGGPSTGLYAGNIDPGLVQFKILDPGVGTVGEMRVIDWESQMVGFQLYLPPGGKIVVTGNYTRARSDNIGQDIPEGGDPARTFKVSEYYDANLFFDITSAVRTGASYQLIRQRYVDGGYERNDRVEIGGLFFF